ncbi:MAG: hypothetical protein DWQ05_19245 [Calditrichaeota bacterium]|nr:MAG: hypothetical protein DWQ05_19245 [Calditrichota bacterium]
MIVNFFNITNLLKFDLNKGNVYAKKQLWEFAEFINSALTIKKGNQFKMIPFCRKREKLELN